MENRLIAWECHLQGGSGLACPLNRRLELNVTPFPAQEFYALNSLMVVRKRGRGEEGKKYPIHILSIPLIRSLAK